MNFPWLSKPYEIQVNLFIFCSALMYTYKLNDLMFFIKTLNSPSAHFDISKYIQFANHSTWAASMHKLSHHRATSSSYQNIFFSRTICLWNPMPVIDLTSSSDTIKTQLTKYLWTKFMLTLHQTPHVRTICFALAISAQNNPSSLTISHCQI